MDNYNFYLEGYNNAISFYEIPDFDTKDNIIAYSLGYQDGKVMIQKTEEQFYNYIN